MASSFLQKKATEQAIKIDKEYGSSSYGGTDTLMFDKNESNDNSTKKVSSFLQNKIKERSSAIKAGSYANGKSTKVNTERTSDKNDKDNLSLNKNSSYNYTSENYKDYYDRAKQLSDMSSWTDDERKEAEAFYNVLAPKGLANGGTIKDWWNDTMYSFTKDAEKYTPSVYHQILGTEWEDIYNTLNYKTHPATTGFMANFVNATGANSLSEAAYNGLEKAGLSENYLNEGRKNLELLNDIASYGSQEAPIASGAGSVTGTLSALAGISEGLGAISGFAKLPTIAQSIISGAGSLGGLTAAQELGNVTSGRETAGEYLGKVGMSAAGGAAGGALSSTFANAGMKFLSNKGLANNTLAQAAAAGLSGSGFAAGNTGTKLLAKELGYDDGEEVSASQLVQDVAVGFAFGSISYLLRRAIGEGFTMKEPKHDWKYFSEDMSADEAKALYRKLSMENHPDRGGSSEIMAEINAEYDLFVSNIADKASKAYSQATKSNAKGDAATAAKAEAEFGHNMLMLQSFVDEGIVVGSEVTEAMEVLNKVMSSGVFATDVSSEQLASLSNKLNTGNSTIMPQTQNVVSETKIEAPKVTATQTLESVKDTLGENGKKALTAAYDGSVDTEDYSRDFIRVYNASKNGIEVPNTTALNEYQKSAAIFAGENDAKIATKLEDVNNGKEVYLRESGQRNDGQNTRSELRTLEENARRNQSWQESSKPADGEAVNLTYSEQRVSAASLGIGGGSNDASVYLVSGGTTKATEKATTIAKTRGLSVTYYAGGYLNIKGSEAQAYISGNRVFVRVDDPNFTADQLMIHEVGHDRIAKGEINLQEVKARVNELTNGQSEQFASQYAEAYAGSGMTADEIFEEVVCDSLARINRFSQDIRTLDVPTQKYMADVRQAVRENSARETRAPAKNEAMSAAVRITEDGPIAFLEEAIVAKPGETQNRAIQRFFNDNLKGKEANIVSSGESAQFDQIGKYLYPGHKVRNMSVKKTAAAILEDMVSVGTNKTHKEDLLINGIQKNHSGLNAERGWDYYNTKFAIDNSGAIWEGTLIIRKAKNGKDYFYDLDNIKEIDRLDVDKVSNPINVGQSPEDIIPQKTDEVKGKMSAVPEDEYARQVNETMTMSQAKRMIEATFNSNDIKSWYDGKYKNADEWLRGEGVNEVAMYAENSKEVIENYINNSQALIDYEVSLEDVLDAYINNTLRGPEKKSAVRLDVSKTTGYSDNRFFAPKEISDAKAKFDIAQQRVTKENNDEVINARKDIIFFAHNQNAAEALGITTSELNKKLQAWSKYPARARDISQRINEGVSFENQWTGIQNSAILNTATVTDSNIAGRVKEIKGDSSAYQRNYIGKTMLALDTHIDWSELTFSFEKSPYASDRALGFYEDNKKLISIGKSGYLNTVAHEMGHALDYKWTRDILVGSTGSAIPLSENKGLTRDRFRSDEAYQFYNNCQIFYDSIRDVGDIRSGYTQRMTETFARFVAKFVEWTNKLAGNNFFIESEHYKDNFTTSQFMEFAKLLQEKSMIDTTEAVIREGKLSRSNQTLEELRAENAALKEKLSDYNKIEKRAVNAERQLSKTSKPTLRREDVSRFTRDRVNDLNSDVNIDEVTKQMQELGDFIVQDGVDGVLSYEDVKDKAIDIARTLVENASELTNGDQIDTIRSIRNYLKGTKFYFDNMRGFNDTVPGYLKNDKEYRKGKGEISDYKHFHAKNLGRFTLTTDKNAMQIDDAWTELQGIYGTEFFPEDINTVPDMVLHISDLLDNITPVYENPFDRDMAEVIEWEANRIIDGLIDESVRQNAPTYADKMERKLAKQKYQDARKYNEALKRVRDKRDADIKKIKQHYKDIAETKKLRREDSASRTRLLKIAKRLNNKKLPAASRALINEYIGELDLVSKSITGKTIGKLMDLREWYEDQAETNPDFIPDAGVEKALQRLSKRQISDLSQDEVSELTNILLNIENEIRTQNKLINSEDKRDTFFMGEQVINDINNSGGKEGLGYKIDRAIISGTLSPVREMHRVTGYVENDPLYVLTNKLADGQREMFDYQRRAGEKFLKWTEDKKFVEQIAGKKAKEISITGIGSNGPTTVKITPAMRMSLYLHRKNAQNMTHIAGGGITVPDIKLYKNGDIAEAYARGITIKLTPSEVDKICLDMSDKERAFAMAAHDYFNGMSQESINKTSEYIKGYSLATVEDYFPINTDRSFLKSEFEALKFDGTIEGMGFLKERVNSAAPIMLRDLNSVLSQSIDQTAKYVGLAIPVRNFNKVWGVTKSSFAEDGTRTDYTSSVQQAIKNKWGETGYKYVEKMMSDINGGRASDEGIWSKALSKIRSNYAGAVLTLNASVAMKQAASYPTAGSVLGFKPLARAMADFGKVDLDIINKYTPLLWYRTQGFSTQELGDMAKQSKSLPKVLNWVQGVDVLTTRKLWKASEYYVRMNNKDLNVGTDAYYKAVADIYNRVIEETQPNYTTMQRPDLLRSNDSLTQSMMMFKTQPFQNFNILYDSFGNLEAKKNAYINLGTDEAKQEYRNAKKDAWNATWSQLMQLAVFAGMTFAWNMFRGKTEDYEDEEGNVTIGSALEQIGKDMLGSQAGSIPFGAEVWEVLNSVIYGDTYYGFDNITASSLDDMANAFIKAGKNIESLRSSIQEGKEVDWKSQANKWSSVIDAVGNATGVPIANVEKLFKAVFLQSAKAASGDYYGEYVYLRYTVGSNSEYYELLWKAKQKDLEAYEKIYSDMVGSGDFEESKIRSAMENKMKKAEGVSSVDELSQRYLNPTQQESYDKMLSEVKKSSVWRQATDEQRGGLEDNLYTLLVETTSENSAGTKMQSKIEGGESVGLTDVEYLLYQLALKMVDEPNKNGNYGTYTNEEKKAAADKVGLSEEEYEYLK